MESRNKQFSSVVKSMIYIGIISAVMVIGAAHIDLIKKYTSIVFATTFDDNLLPSTDNAYNLGDNAVVQTWKNISIGNLLNLGQISSDPGGACTNGSVYYNSSANNFRGCQGGAWGNISPWANSGSNIYFNSGKVGIGNAGPSQDLDVTGNINFTGTLDVNATSGVATQLLTSQGASAPTWSDAPVSSAIPSGYVIFGITTTTPAGYTYTGSYATTTGNFWTTMTAMPTSSQNFVATTVNNIIYAMVAGGNYSGNFAYDPSSNTWSTKTSVPTARSSPAAAVVNNIIYVIGGSIGGSTLDTNEAYDPSIDFWSTKAVMTTARAYLTAAAANNIIYAIGGCATSLCSTGNNINEAYDPSNNTWSTKAIMPTARMYLRSATVNNIIYVIGGYSNPSYFGTNEAYDPSSNVWSTKAAMTARDNHAVAVVNNIIYAIGGYNGSSYLGTNEAYDPSSNAWSTKTVMTTARANLAGAAVNNIIYAMGGCGGSFCGTHYANNEAYSPIINYYIFTQN